MAPSENMNVAQGANGASGGFDNNTALAVAEGRLHDVRFAPGLSPSWSDLWN